MIQDKGSSRAEVRRRCGGPRIVTFARDEEERGLANFDLILKLPVDYAARRHGPFT